MDSIVGTEGSLLVRFVVAFVIVLALNLVGDAVRDILDPRAAAR